MKSTLKGLCVSVYVVYALIAVTTGSPLEMNAEPASAAAHDLVEQHHSKSKTYFLKCVHEQCSLIESAPHLMMGGAIAEKNVSLLLLFSSNRPFQIVIFSTQNAEEQQLGSGEDMKSKRSSDMYLNTLMKRFFGVNEEAVKMYKPDKIECWTDDCKVQMAKISRQH
jgi:hypothetical protein